MADQECSIDDIPPQYQEIFCSLNDTTGDNYRAFVCKDGSMVGTDKYIINDLDSGECNWPLEGEIGFCDQSINTNLSDLSNMNSIQCDSCLTLDETTCETNEDCYWKNSDTIDPSVCKNKCSARMTMGECEQYTMWNQSSDDGREFSFDGQDHKCMWYPDHDSIDNTYNSTEGICRPIIDETTQCISQNTTNIEGSSCEFLVNGSGVDGTTISLSNQNYCVPNDINNLGDIYCTHNYIESNEDVCNNSDHSTCNSIEGCELLDSIEGRCISDGLKDATGSLLSSDSECSVWTNNQEACSDLRGQGCLWEPPRDSRCVSNKLSILNNYENKYDELLTTCNPLQAHIDHSYDINLIEDEGIDVAGYRDRNNKEYPYQSSKYLCDVCSIRNNDLDKMNNLTELENKYFILGEKPLSDSQKQEYCEKSIDMDNSDDIPCMWDEGQCKSVCSQFSPPEVLEQPLEDYRQQCITHKFYPTGDVHSVTFPNYNSDNEEITDNYYNERYCTWDGFECHNSIPCKYAQQVRCEDLGYDWYEGTATDIENQEQLLNKESALELSTSYPVEHKGDGQPVKGDMEGICIYPSSEQPGAQWIGTPLGYQVENKYVGHQTIILKWAEWGTGWWEDNNLQSKTEGFPSSEEFTQQTGDNYFLGEHVALIPFEVENGDTTDDIKGAINSALQSYEYFILNGEWTIWAKDLVESIQDNYNSIRGTDDSNFTDTMNNEHTYGYNYYSQQATDIPNNINSDNHKVLNAIYDLRGTIGIIPVVGEHPLIEIHILHIVQGNLEFELKDNTPKFQFIQIMGSEIFDQNITDNTGTAYSPLTITTLSKYKYSDDSISLLPPSVVAGYGSLYERTSINDKLQVDCKNLREITKYDIRNNTPSGDDFSCESDIAETGTYEQLSTLMDTIYGVGVEPGSSAAPHWALANEFTNNNHFSQPILHLNDELRHCVYGVSGAGGAYSECSGSLESWRNYNSEGQIPSYQTINLYSMTPFVKIMALYSNYSTIQNTNPTLTGDSIKSFQPTSLLQAALWSLSRNTPSMWGNLFYTRDESIYTNNSNFNRESNTDAIFENDIDENTLLRPFADNSSDSIAGNPMIRWDNILKYIGGNKREVQLTRNVSNLSYDSYIDSYGVSSDRQIGSFNVALSKTELNNQFINSSMSDIISNSKLDYIIRGLNDNSQRLQPDSRPAKLCSGTSCDDGSTIDNIGSMVGSFNHNTGGNACDLCSSGISGACIDAAHGSAYLGMDSAAFFTNAGGNGANNYPNITWNILSAASLHDRNQYFSSSTHLGKNTATPGNTYDENYIGNCGDLYVQWSKVFIPADLDDNTIPYPIPQIPLIISDINEQQWTSGDYSSNSTGLTNLTELNNLGSSKLFFNGSNKRLHSGLLPFTSPSSGQIHPWKFYKSTSPNMEIPSKFNPNNDLIYSDYYRLGFLPEPSGTDVSTSSGLLPWGDPNNGSCSRDTIPTIGYTELEADMGENITYGSSELYEWCTREKESLSKPGGGIYNEAEQEDRNMGILYRGDEIGWYAGNESDQDTNGNGIFARNKLTNAYYYPEMCEVFRMKSGSNTYGDIVDWVDVGDLSSATYPGTSNSEIKNMLHPLSLTCARPLEKDVYINITPNNGLEIENTNPLFVEILDENDNDIAFTGTIANNDIVNNYSLIIDTTDEISSFYHWFHTGSDTNSELKNIINYHYATNILINYIDIDTTFNYNLSTEALTNEHWSSISSDNTPFFNLNILDDSRYIVLGEGATAQLDWHHYYNNELPPQSDSTYSVTKSLFGNGFPTHIKYTGNQLNVYPGNEYQPPCDDTLESCQNNISPIDPTSSYVENEGNPDRLQINSLSDLFSRRCIESTPPEPYLLGNSVNFIQTESGEYVCPDNSIEVDPAPYQCQTHIETKITCENPNNWINQDGSQYMDGINADPYEANQIRPSVWACMRCFNEDMSPTMESECTSSNNLLLSSGDSPKIIRSVCEQIVNNINTDVPWRYMGIDIQPPDWGNDSDISTSIENPYNDINNNCEISGNSDIFTRINPTQGEESDITFFKPVRDTRVSDIFYNSGYTGGDESNVYGCIRNDISVVDEDYFELSCNTNTSSSFGRDKHVIINYIINHGLDENGNLLFNVSDRTKLAVMNDEELINKAVELGMDISEMNEYTKPKLVNKYRDIYDSTNNRFEIWDKLENIYLNLVDGSDTKPEFSLKEWDYIGCGLDFNNYDESMGSNSCKDKYPGLCSYNQSKCDDPNILIKQAMRLDCPETCETQYTDLDVFEAQQSGFLSVCSVKGRCKWSYDQDPSNLLPYCDDNTSREIGDSEKCQNYLTNPINSSIGDNNCNSIECKEQKCVSITGCDFIPNLPQGCTLSNSVRTEDADGNPLTLQRCNSLGGEWIASQLSCVLDEFFDPNISEGACSAVGGSYSMGRVEDCIFNPDWHPLTDPCNNHLLESLSEEEKQNYLVPNSVENNYPFIIESIMPVRREGSTGVPDAIELTIRRNRNDPTTNDTPFQDQLTELFQDGDYIQIDRSSEISDYSENCSQLLVGMNHVNIDSSVFDNPPNDLDVMRGIVISKNNEAYTLELDEFGNYIFGDCQISSHYRLNNDIYDERCICSSDYTKGTGEECDDIQDNTNYISSSCTYKESINPKCVSCSFQTKRDDSDGEVNNACIYDDSLCGWGNLSEICATIGDLGECNDMHSEGCQWNQNRSQCELNPLKLHGNEGNNEIQGGGEGCMACSDAQHRHTCNSLSNCYWSGNEGNFYNGIIPEGWSGENVDATNDGGLTFQSMEVPSPLIDETSGEEIPWTEGDVFTIEMPSENPDIVPTCNSCSQVADMESCNSYNVTQGQCQWVSRNNTPERCHPTKLYPIFGDWIIYNWKFLLFILVTIIALVKIPTKSINDTIPYMGTILKIIILFVGIPAASKIYGPSINPEYKDPVVNPTNPSFIDLLYDNDPQGATWPAIVYDDELDYVVLDDETTYDIYQGSLTPGMLDWTAAFWWLIRKWNNFVNSMGVIGGSVFVLLISIYLVRYSPGPLITTSIIGGLIIALIIINYIATPDSSDDVYDGNELECPYGADVLCPNIDEDKDTCPAGCYSLVHNQMCKDNRNILAFGEIMDPDPKQDVGNYQDLSFEDRAIWLESDDSTYTCPPPIDPPRKKYPYNWLCNDPPEEENPNCPFDRVIGAAEQPDLTDFEQRSSGNIWESIFGDQQGAQDTRDSQITNWQNQTRYHIIGENY